MALTFYDTNALLSLRESAFIEKFACSHKTLEEIESIKTSGKKDDETRYRARKVARAFQDGNNYIVCNYPYDRIVKELAARGLEVTPDAIITTEAYLLNSETDDVVFVTDDVNCYNIAKNIFGLKTETLNSIKEDIYEGYIKISGTTDEINEQMDVIDMSKLYANEYIVIDDKSIGKTKEMRFDGKKFVELKLPPSGFIKGKNSLQRCALDALNNKDIDIVAILGTYGSGKSFLSMQMGLYGVNEKGYQSKILGVREARGEGSAVGYLPGEFEQKVGDFFKPLEQQLKGGEFELQSLKQRGVLDVQIPYYLKGTTYDSTIMVVDEAEDLTESQLRLVGTRLGQNSRIFFSGDYKQSLINKTISNPLVKMCDEFKGSPNFACVFLDTDVRSEASKMFATLFKQ
jgi:predicted ribonuclease YlaK